MVSRKPLSCLRVGVVVDDSRKSKHSQVLRLTLLVLAIAAFVMVCTSIGKTRPTGCGPQKIEGVTLASTSERGTVIADSEGDRLLFVNPSGQLVGMHGLDGKETPITSATIIRQVGEDVFVAGIAHAEDGESIKTEGVLKFNMDGEYLGTVWKKDYEKDAVQAMQTIRDITIDDEGNLILIQFGLHEDIDLYYDGTVTRYPQNAGDGQVLRKAVSPGDYAAREIRYDPKGDRCAMTDIYGGLFVERDNSGKGVRADTGNTTMLVKAFDINGDRAVVYDGKSHVLFRAENLFGDTQLRLEELGAGMQCNTLRLCGDTVTMVLDNDVVRIYDLQSGSSKELAEIPLIAKLAAYSIVLSVCRAYLVVLFVVLAIRWFARNIRQRRLDKVRRVIFATTVSLICMAGIVFHMVSVFYSTLSLRETNMSQIVSQASVTSPAELGDAATNEAKRALRQTPLGNDNKDLSTIAINLEGIVASSFANSAGVLCTIYTTAEDGEVYSLYSNERSTVVMDSVQSDEMKSAISKVIQAANEHEGAYKGPEKAYYFARSGKVQTVIRRNSRGQDVVSCIAPLIAKDGTCCTALEVSCHVESMLNTMMDNVLGVLLIFVMTVASIVIISDEAIRSGSVYLRYKKMREEGVEWAEILMGRPLCFVVSFAFSMDAAFAVVVAKDMLAKSGMESTPLMLGIPTLAITTGAAIGTLIHVVMCSRVSGRSYALPVLLLGIASQLLCFFAVVNTWFAVFIACKLVSSASLATIQFVAKNRAGATHSKDFGEERLPLLVKRSPVNIAGKGAAVVAGVVGGVLTYIGDQWVYIAAALAGVAVIPILLLACPKGSVISKHGDRANMHSAFKFLASPIMLVSLAFGIFPTVLASGYKSFILPLFLDSAGISKSDISCLFAVGNAILYMFSDSLISRRDKRGRWVMTWVGLIGLGVLFVLFSCNQAPVWAVVSIVLITVLSWFASDWKHNARGWAKRDYGFSYDQAQTMLNTEESVVKNAQAPVLSALLSLGTSVCCLILGIFFVISGVCYYFPTRKRKDSA